MASSSSSRKCIKWVATKQRDPDIDGWISDLEAQDNFGRSFRNRKIINHKHVELPFFHTHGFAFPDLLSLQNLETFVQLKGNVYPDLVRVFYANLECEKGLLTPRVKGGQYSFNPRNLDFYCWFPDSLYSDTSRVSWGKSLGHLPILFKGSHYQMRLQYLSGRQDEEG
ncbi:hypothetical protein DEO72_LG1g2784 [Vigna unguiculata]|uniref:Uncharacterized protein n=1 Tax=Vigna unguiculata TaxID=3917 RepID=A0A4D6KRH0_VIGUN|nr:hypothetical protein DEO72_LG1g2784 [Vigna unguiculata]